MIQQHRVKLNDVMVYMTMQMVHKICEGEEKEQYGRLRNYAHKLYKEFLYLSVYL